MAVCSAIIGRSRKDFKKYLFNFIAAMPAVSASLGLKIYSAIRMAQIKTLRRTFQRSISESVGSSCFMWRSVLNRYTFLTSVRERLLAHFFMLADFAELYLVFQVGFVDGSFG